MKLKKIIALGLAVITVMLGTMMTVSAATVAESNITVKVNGNEVDFPDQYPVIRNNRTLVPVRFVAEALGYDVDWNAEERSVLIDGGKIVLYIGSDKAFLDGVQTTLDVEPVIINNRTMIPLRIVAETLNCTVDWFETNRTVLVNARDKNGNEMSVFDRYKQSDLFWCYTTADREYLVWKDDYRTLADASAPTNYHDWWIERELDKSILLNQSLDCTVMMKAFTAEDLRQVKDMLFTAYPTQYREAYDIMMQTITGEVWETFYPETSELYPLYSAVAPRSGTFGTTYLDGREVEMYMDYNGITFTMNLSAEGYKDPEKPIKLSDSEIALYTKEAKNRYCLGLWGLD
mgnify:CR=1 FL=1